MSGGWWVASSPFQHFGPTGPSPPLPCPARRVQGSQPMADAPAVALVKLGRRPLVGARPTQCASLFLFTSPQSLVSPRPLICYSSPYSILQSIVPTYC